MPTPKVVELTDVKVVADTFTKVVNKTVNSIRRKYTSEYKAIEKLVKG